MNTWTDMSAKKKNNLVMIKRQKIRGRGLWHTAAHHWGWSRYFSITFVELCCIESMGFSDHWPIKRSTRPCVNMKYWVFCQRQNLIMIADWRAFASCFDSGGYIVDSSELQSFLSPYSPTAPTTKKFINNVHVKKQQSDASCHFDALRLLYWWGGLHQR